jgi:hypothetical protein
MIHLPELDVFNDYFSRCTYDPIKVTIHLRPNSRIVNYDPIHLDGLLAWAVVLLATEGRGLPDREDGYWIPLPLKMLWQSDGGYPLWAASILYPASPALEDIYVRHKRNSGGWLHDKPKLVTRNGPWMERRLPTPMRICDTYEARCIGNRDEVQNLLSIFTHIGKLRLGRVRDVNVEVCDYNDEDVFRAGDTLLRPIPAASELIPWSEKPSLVGWTPPYWKPSLFMEGWRAMSKIFEVRDFFFEVDCV